MRMVLLAVLAVLLLAPTSFAPVVMALGFGIVTAALLALAAMAGTGRSRASPNYGTAALYPDPSTRCESPDINAHEQNAGQETLRCTIRGPGARTAT